MRHSPKRFAAIISVSSAVYFLAAVGLHRAYPTIVMPVKIDASSHESAMRSVESMLSTLDPVKAFQLQTALAIIGFNGLTPDQLADPSFDSNSHTYARMKLLEGMGSIQITQYATSLAAANKQRKFMNAPPQAPADVPAPPAIEAPSQSITSARL